MLKFGRNYKLTVQGSDSNQYVIEPPFTIEFAIQQALFSSALQGSIKVYNLSKDTRNLLYKDSLDTKTYGAYGRSITFEAGYGDSLSTILKGNVLKCESYRPERSVNFFTEIIANNNLWAMRNCNTNWSSNGAITKNAVISQLLSDLSGSGVKRGYISDFSGDYSRGRVMIGNTWDLLRTETGGNCFIDSGRVHCLKTDDYFEGEVVLINSDSGLLGTPKKSGNCLVFEMLFEPRLQIGQKIHIDSAAQTLFNSDRLGDFQITAIEHNGIISETVDGMCKTAVSIALPVNQLRILTGQEVLA